MADAGFESVLAVVLLLGVVFGTVDEHDYATPASDIVLVVFAFGLFGFAVFLGELVKREVISDTVLRALAVGNAGFAVLIAVWVLVADGFTDAGRAVVWVTVAALLMLAALQAQQLRR